MINPHFNERFRHFMPYGYIFSHNTEYIIPLKHSVMVNIFGEIITKSCLKKALFHFSKLEILIWKSISNIWNLVSKDKLKLKFRLFWYFIALCNGRVYNSTNGERKLICEGKNCKMNDECSINYVDMILRIIDPLPT